MSAVEDYNRVAAREREWNKTHHSHVIERLADTADAALAEETARADRAEAALARIDRIVFDVPKTGDPDSAVMDIARIVAEVQP